MKPHYFLCLISLSVSCTTVYQPSAVVTPVLEEKGDLEVQATVRMGDMTGELVLLPISGVTVNGGLAYAVSDKVAAIVNAEYQNELYKNGPYAFTGENRMRYGYLGEIYVGRYFSNSASYNSSVFIGVGKGYRDLTFDQYSLSTSNQAYFETDYMKASLLCQHTFRKKLHANRDRFHFTLLGRISYVRNFNSHFYSTNNYYMKSSLQDYRHSLTLEPGFSVSLLLGRFAVFAQNINSWNLFGHPTEDTEGFNVLMSIGTRIKLN